ncbi:hypothetical protein PNA2_0949 [Pyrococcus sp. NA2]|uniref:outer membrane protein assembly factor BamB family protein n=1 Tax=Pyrococcus sp. (strain NA2) TaxID=342949 RepID=UPI000209A91B|nr:PQQ-binding-like beta-propeller repeat protein [Pyrococcus sp. NA2]AEC51864.1 hypothetical protein PNA2_0949 [Pyrococcus sp. NA2]
MKRILPILILTLILPWNLAWNGQLCSNVKYQKSIEAVAMDSSAIYASCSYRIIVNSSTGLISVYYLGTTGAFARNGTKLWEIDSGFVTKLALWNDKLLIGSLSGLIKVEKNGSYVGRYVSNYKMYDFDIKGDYAYIASGDIFTMGMRGNVAKVYLPNMTSVWNVSIDQMPGRIRVGVGIIYVGTGYPSGYAGSKRFGEVIGISEDGKVLWKVNVGEWVRDLEVWKGYAVVGTGYNNTGHLLIIDKNGKVIMNMTLFYVEDVLIDGDIAYVSGYKRVAAIDLENGKKIWEASFPYRIRVLKLYRGKLLAGGGDFLTRNNTVYSVGDLYVLNPKNGKVLREITTGYVRSIAVGNGLIAIGTGSNIIEVLKDEEVLPREICGPGILLLLLLLAKKLQELK